LQETRNEGKGRELRDAGRERRGKVKGKRKRNTHQRYLTSNYNPLMKP